MTLLHRRTRYSLGGQEDSLMGTGSGFGEGVILTLSGKSRPAADNNFRFQSQADPPLRLFALIAAVCSEVSSAPPNLKGIHFGARLCGSMLPTFVPYTSISSCVTIAS
jgi:hypothetical protein